MDDHIKKKQADIDLSETHINDYITEFKPLVKRLLQTQNVIRRKGLIHIKNSQQLGQQVEQIRNDLELV